MTLGYDDLPRRQTIVCRCSRVDRYAGSVRSILSQLCQRHEFVKEPEKGIQHLDRWTGSETQWTHGRIHLNVCTTDPLLEVVESPTLWLLSADGQHSFWTKTHLVQCTRVARKPII